MSLTPNTLKRVKTTSKFATKPGDSYGINVHEMRYVHVPRGTLPTHPAFMATKLCVKGFCSRNPEENVKRELAVQRIIAIVAPDMAIPMVRNRGADGKGVPEVVMRWGRGLPECSKRVQRTEKQEFEYGAMVLLDILSGMADRHSGNWVIGPVHLYPIDHESCRFSTMKSVEQYDYRVRNLSNTAKTGALWMAERIGENARPVARWMTVAMRSDKLRVGEYTEKQVRVWAEAACKSLSAYMRP